MNFKSTFLLTISLFLVFSCQNTPVRNVASEHYIAPNTKQLVDWETKANNISKRSNELIRVEHYEIPLRLLAQDFEDSIDPLLKESIFFTKDGETYVRWLINPEDTQWIAEVRWFLAKNKIPVEPKKFFDGYFTASRSMVIVNPENGATFSLKVSTNQTGGKWIAKKQTWDEAQQIRKVNRYVKFAFPTMESDSLILLDEPLALGIKDINHAMVLRSFNNISDENFSYMPAFSAFHETEGVRIAKLNGSNNPVKYWDEHLNKPLARAMAEYFSKTGLWFDSAHAQNFLIELDRDQKPTGRIVLRDLGDAYLLKDFVKNTLFASMATGWEYGRLLEKNRMFTTIGLLKGNNPPKWINEREYKELGWSFYSTFEKRLSELTGITHAELNDVTETYEKWRYTNKGYATTSEPWKRFLKYANCMQGQPRTLAGELCPEFFLKNQSKGDCAKSIRAFMHQ